MYDQILRSRSVNVLMECSLCAYCKFPHGLFLTPCAAAIYARVCAAAQYNIILYIIIIIIISVLAITFILFSAFVIQHFIIRIKCSGAVPSRTTRANAHVFTSIDVRVRNRTPFGAVRLCRRNGKMRK